MTKSSINAWKELSPFYILGQHTPLTLSKDLKPVKFKIDLKADDILVIFDFSTLELKSISNLIHTIQYLIDTFQVSKENLYLVYSSETRPLHLKGYREIIMHVAMHHPFVHVRAISGSIHTKMHYDFQMFVQVDENPERLVARIKATDRLLNEVLTKEVNELREIYRHFLSLIEEHNEGIVPLFHKIIDIAANSPLTKRNNQIEKLLDHFQRDRDPENREHIRRQIIVCFLQAGSEIKFSFLTKLSESVPSTTHVQTLDDLEMALSVFLDTPYAVIPDALEKAFVQFLGQYRGGVFHPPLFMTTLDEMEKAVALLKKRIDFLPEGMSFIIKSLEINYLQLYSMHTIMNFYRQGTPRAKLHNPFTFGHAERKRYNGIMAAFAGQPVFFAIKKFLYEAGITIH